jgi:hypothetical protein
VYFSIDCDNNDHRTSEGESPMLVHCTPTNTCFFSLQMERFYEKVRDQSNDDELCKTSHSLTDLPCQGTKHNNEYTNNITFKAYTL